MKAHRLMKSALISAVLLGPITSANAAGFGHRGSNVAVTTTLSAQEIATLEFMREEEKLARDVYLTLNEYWGTQTAVFANIAESEQQHTSTVEFLLDKYDLDDPVVRDEICVFVNPQLQALYDSLVEKGTASMIDGLYVGALIEEKDMQDILAAIEETDERPIILGYSNLLDGSKNHLRAFVDVIEKQGLVYEAQLLEQDEVDLILTAAQ